MTLGTSVFVLMCLILVINFPKQSLKLILIIFGFITLGWLLYSSKELNEKAINNSIKINITYDTIKCSEEYPLFIKILNNSNKTVHEIEFGLSAYHPGHSKNIFDYNSYDIDKIIKKGETFSLCLKIPKINKENFFSSPETTSPAETFPVKITGPEEKAAQDDKLAELEILNIIFGELVYKLSYKHIKLANGKFIYNSKSEEI